MYKNRKFNRNAKTAPTTKDNKKRALNDIDENETIKLSRKEDTSAQSKNTFDAIVEVHVLAENSSEEHIPASQEPTQRYLSQRSTSALTRTQSRLGSNRPPNSYFEMVLMNAGVHLDEADLFVLSCDHVAFVSTFREQFIKSPNYPENIETFKVGLRNALAVNSKLLYKLLSGCTINAAGENSIYQSQDSMIVNFLMISFLRTHVLEVLLDVIADVACANTKPAASNSNNVPLLPLMLAQLRYVTVTDGELIYMRIKDIFQKANNEAKWDIIANAECILDSSRHDDFVQLLFDNMSSSKDIFHATTIQTLTNLCLSVQMQGKLRCKILAYIKDNQCSNKTLPVLIKCLLKFLNEENDDCVRELVNTLREILLWRSNTTAANAPDYQAQLELFKYIEQGLTRSKKFYYAWQKTIAALGPHQFRSIDFIILLLLVYVKEDNFLFIENILRRRIKLELVTVDILNDMKTKYVAILEEHIYTLMQFLHDFLRERNKIVVDFAISAYSILFRICDTIQKFILKKLLELTCDKSAQNMINLALELLRDLHRKYPVYVQNWGLLLMPLLDSLNELTLSQTRIVMELLCSVAYPMQTLAECPMLQDQIDMLVKKQMINRTPLIKKQAIIGSVQLIDSIARIENTCIETDYNEFYSGISDLPEGRGKIAAKLVERINSSTLHCPESLALFYDELAHVCASAPNDRANSGYLDKAFLVWLCEALTQQLQNNFLANKVTHCSRGIELTHQKCINTAADVSTEGTDELLAIAVNISQLVLQPTTDAASSIHVLMPLFNLVCVLHSQRHEGSLEQIDALIGCAIVLPKFFENANAADILLHDYDQQMQAKLLDIYFNCANWMRETISSFATQQESMLRNKVLLRLADLIKLEEQIRKLLEHAPVNYAAPISCFVNDQTTLSISARVRSTSAHKTKHKGKTHALQTVDESMDLTNENNADQTALGDTTLKLANAAKSHVENNKINFEILYGPKECYRQMSLNIMLLLHEKLNTSYPLPLVEEGSQIGLCELRFILTDLVCKLESVTGVRKFNSETPLQYIAKPHYFMSDLSRFLRTISQHMETLASAINAQLELVKCVYSHADLFTEKFSYMKVCFGLCLHLFSAFFSWSEFADRSKAELLKTSLLAVLDETTAQQLAGKSTAEIALALFEKCLKYECATVELKAAVHLYQLMCTLKRLLHAHVVPTTPTNADAFEKHTQEIRALCKTLLSRKWFSYNNDLEKGALCNVYLDELVKGFLKQSDFKRQREILNIILNECKQLTGKENALKSFPNFKKANFPLLFRGLCETLITSVSDFIATNDSDAQRQLKVWERSCHILNLQLDVVQSLDVPRNFQLFLKYSHLYLKLLLQHCFTVLEQFLRQDPDRVSEMLHSLQITTRFLHKICCHSKALKNTTIVNQIPFLRETVENLVFRVKALLVANKCASAFWMGNLRNKDLQGDEIRSQNDSLSSTESQDSDEEIPDDEVSIDETLLGEDETASTCNNRSKSTSRSKCF